MNKIGNAKIFALNKKLLTVLLILVFALIGTLTVFLSRAETSLTADFNSDDTVNVYDLSILANNWGKTEATPSMGDANNDSVVNILDLSILASQWGQNAGTPTSYAITSLSSSHALAGSTITITGQGFGATQGTSTVTFGERINELGFAPVSKTATVNSWSDTSITVTVPGMSPGKAGATGTYHPVYVTVGGTMTNSMDFYMDPVKVNPSISNATRTVDGNGHVTYTSADSTGIWPSSNSINDSLFENCTFTATNQTIRGSQFGVLTLGQGGDRTHSRVTFLNCTFTSNTGVGSYEDYGVNGVKVVTGYGSTDRVFDISFVNSTFGEFSRMGYEQVGDVESNNIAFIDTTFEPTGAEPISFNGGNLNSLISGSTFKGSGNLSGSYNGWSLPQYSGTIESNTGRYLEIRDSHIWAYNGLALNFSGAAGTESKLLVKGVDIDVSHTYQAVPTSGGSRMFGFQHVSYVRLKDCVFNTGSVANHLYNAGWSNASYDPTAPNWYSATYNDFSGSTITGYVTDATPSPGIPSTAKDYWDSSANNTNIWPTKN